jgi:hypothetical protein
MKRLLVRGFQGLLILLVVLYAIDWGTWRLRGASSTVQVEQFLRTPLKGTKEEFDYMGTVAQTCPISLFPHGGEKPCWWLERHTRQWVSP